MILDTRRLFLKLLPRLHTDTVCDVGSMDGADALAFRAALPEAAIYAFEANPENFRRMEASAGLAAGNIQLVCAAVSNRCGHADFFLVQADYAQPDVRRGMSSLHRRADGWSSPGPTVPVTAVTLEAFLRPRCAAASYMALWIDTEGAAYEVIEGAAGIAPQVRLIHVEVEATPCIAPSQRLYPEVQALLRSLGFVQLATDREAVAAQFNALFVRRDLPRWLAVRVRASLMSARLRYRAVELLRRACPACLRTYHAWRTRHANAPRPRA